MYIWLIVIASAFWVLIDAKNIGVRKGLVLGMGNMGPWSWFFVTLFLWIIGFPMYLVYRGKFKLAIANVSDSSKMKCNSCGIEIPDEAKFCTSCGLPIPTKSDKV